MARYPLHPRLSRLIVEACRRGVADDGCAIAAVLSAGERLPETPRHNTRSDLLALIDAEWEPRTRQTVRQIRQMLPRVKSARMPAVEQENALLLSILAAFPDRVARRRQSNDLQLASGAPAQLASSSTVTDSEFLVAVEAEDRSDRKSPLVRLASAIEPAWLLDLFPDRVRATARVEWNRAAERVEGVEALLFEQIAIEESRGAPEPEPATELLAAKAIEAGVARFADPEELDAWMRRVEFVSRYAAIPSPEPDAVERALQSLARGLKSFAELESAARGGGLLRSLKEQWTRTSRQLIEDVAPERIQLPGGRRVPVHYESGQPPWIASRLQDFFGMQSSPRVARGAVPVVVRLLAPNQRPVQTTSDLAGFWERLYPQVRKELMRRYPKHAWPENPVNRV
jgi:ATP-dependent helicase HrpB